MQLVRNTLALNDMRSATCRKARLGTGPRAKIQSSTATIASVTPTWNTREK
jgi:hypothetical protein